MAPFYEADVLFRIMDQRYERVKLAHILYLEYLRMLNHYKLLEAFDSLTNCPVLINTSFNVRGEPIVESPEDAYRCFKRTGMDYLVLGTFVLNKKEQPEFNEAIDWQTEFKLD